MRSNLSLVDHMDPVSRWFEPGVEKLDLFREYADRLLTNELQRVFPAKTVIPAQAVPGACFDLKLRADGHSAVTCIKADKLVDIARLKYLPKHPVFNIDSVTDDVLEFGWFCLCCSSGLQALEGFLKKKVEAYVQRIADLEDPTEWLSLIQIPAMLSMSSADSVCTTLKCFMVYDTPLDL